MVVEVKIKGMEDFSQKIENLSSNRTVKRIARKASRQAMNVARDAARSNAKMIDAGYTTDQI